MIDGSNSAVQLETVHAQRRSIVSVSRIFVAVPRTDAATQRR